MKNIHSTQRTYSICSQPLKQTISMELVSAALRLGVGSIRVSHVLMTHRALEPTEVLLVLDMDQAHLDRVIEFLLLLFDEVLGSD